MLSKNGMLELTAPVEITPRLLPGVRIGDAYISIEYSARPGSEGRIRYQYHIDLPADPDTADPRTEHTGDDMQSGCGGGSLQAGLESLLSFLGACGESVSYAAHAGHDGENSDMFPEAIGEWAAQCSDELSMLQIELEETPDLIRE